MKILFRFGVVFLLALAASTLAVAQSAIRRADSLEDFVEPGEPWDLVYMTDSSGWGVPEPYARLAEEALDVEVRVHDLSLGGLAAESILEFLDTRYYSRLFREAEIIVVIGNPYESGTKLPQPDVWSCASLSTERRPPPAVSTDADWKPYRDVLGQVFDRIWEVREGRPAVIRAVDIFTPVLGRWREAGVDAACTREWTMMSNQIRMAAEAHGVEFVSVFDALNGPNHDRDLAELGWVRGDHQHMNDAGAAAIADALANAGFAPLLAP